MGLKKGVYIQNYVNIFYLFYKRFMIRQNNNIVPVYTYALMLVFSLAFTFT